MEKFGQSLSNNLFSISKFDLNFSLHLRFFLSLKTPIPVDPKSLAIPSTPAQSGLLGVIAISKVINS